MFDPWGKYPFDFIYSSECENGRSSFIILDHIFTLTRSEVDILDAGVLHLVQNMSDHEVNYVKIKSANIEIVSDRNDKNPVKSKPSWKEASEDNKLEYQGVLFKRLNSMEIPECLSCEDPKCKSDEHVSDIDD